MIDRATLGEVADVVSGVGFPKVLQGNADGEVPVFKVGDISSAFKSGSRYLRRSPNHLSHESARQLAAKLMPAGTIVFAKIGEGLRLNRRAVLAQPSLVDNNVMGLIPTSLVKSDRPRLMLCDKAYRLRAKLDVAIPAFLEVALNSPALLDRLDELKSGISDSGLNLTQRRFGELLVPLPSLAERQRIVDEVDRRLSLARGV